MDKEESTIYIMRSPPPPSTPLVREHIISAFALQLILCLKVPAMSCTLQLFLFSGKIEMIFMDVIDISALYWYILEEK